MNKNLDLAPGLPSGSAPGVNSSALARLMAVKMPPPPSSRGASAQDRLAAAISRLPSKSLGKNASSLFLP